MALVPIKTATKTGYCKCICGCYELCALRDEETGRGFCRRCAEQHLEQNRAVVAKIPAPRRPERDVDPLPPGFKPPAVQNSRS